MPYKQPKSPFWWISYTDPSGRRIRRSSGTENHAEAKALEQRLRAEAFEARDQPVAPETMFASVMVAYLKSRTSERERYAVLPLREAFGDRDLASLKPADITAYTDARRQAGKTNATIRRELIVLSAAINHYAHEHGLTLPNPVRGRLPDKPDGRVRWISREESAALLDAAADGPEYLADFVRLGLNTGMRKQEMLGLEWSRVNLGERLLFLESHHTKTKKRRSIPINEESRLALLRRWNWCQQHCQGGKWVFCEKDGARIGDVKKSFRSACQRAGIENYHIHDLRHTCAAWLVTAGAPLAAVRDLLGHTSITTTEIYAHLAPTAVRAAVDILSGCHTERHIGQGLAVVNDANC